jgi:hypothetical protein
MSSITLNSFHPCQPASLLAGLLAYAEEQPDECMYCAAMQLSSIVQLSPRLLLLPLLISTRNVHYTAHGSMVAVVFQPQFWKFRLRLTAKLLPYYRAIKLSNWSETVHLHT